MNVVEIGRIRCMANDIAEAVKAEIAKREVIKDFEWSWFDPKCQSQIYDIIRDKLNERLPEHGYIIEATKDEIRALPFNALSKPVTLSPVDTSCGGSEGKPLTLSEAIIHAEEVARKLGKTPCATQHAQLAGWLRELYRLQYGEDFCMK